MLAKNVGFRVLNSLKYVMILTFLYFLCFVSKSLINFGISCENQYCPQTITWDLYIQGPGFIKNLKCSFSSNPSSTQIWLIKSLDINWRCEETLKDLRTISIRNPGQYTLHWYCISNNKKIWLINDIYHISLVL